MKFADKGENKRLIERLERSVKDGRISHAYLFECPGNVDREAFAKALIKGILCPAELSPDRRGENCGKCEICSKIDHDNHEDVMYIEKDGNSIRNRTVASLQDRLKIKPLMSRNIAVIYDSGLMTKEAQNRLLKTLEEPPGDATLILFADNREDLVSTILSRCVKFRINSPAGKRSRKEANLRAKADEIVAMSLRGEPYYRVMGTISGSRLGTEEAMKLLDEMETVYRNLVIDDKEDAPLYDFERLYEGIFAIEEARKAIRNKGNVRYALGNLVLKIDK